MSKKLILTAAAHCDIPCGIYEPVSAKLAAKTVQRMVLQLAEFALPMNWNDPAAAQHYLQGVNRRIAIKEQHAEQCKRELQILWSDFFKPEHLKQFPDLHEKFWQAQKLCSKNKQEISRPAALELIGAVDAIAAIFYQVKKAPGRLTAYHELTDHVF